MNEYDDDDDDIDVADSNNDDVHVVTQEQAMICRTISLGRICVTVNKTTTDRLSNSNAISLKSEVTMGDLIIFSPKKI